MSPIFARHVPNPVPEKVCLRLRKSFAGSAKRARNKWKPAVSQFGAEIVPFPLNGGGGGNRTPVPKSFQHSFYECSPSFKISLSCLRGTGYEKARPLLISPPSPVAAVQGLAHIVASGPHPMGEGLGGGAALITRQVHSCYSQLNCFPGVLRGLLEPRLATAFSWTRSKPGRPH